MRALSIRPIVSVLAAASCLASTAALAGTVEVQFVEPDKYADARDGLHRREDVMKAFADRLKQLGEKRLPPSQSLRIEVLDIDLAGDAFPRVALRDTRVLRGRADWPRMHLRYTLREGDKVLKNGEEHISDMNYLMSTRLWKDEPFPYEKRMLDQWFSERIAAAPAR
ncbi:DUF3016 domain-containing protein [Aquincola sp. S2]|uniref:DUF3016 domain-containing protein n=1 Tax=Pseudaquabacterium terrae TaxID=2732868 RepID=A0ABX2ENC2_9BURK|nr:DUF3016 domain-containing protein [Aquabacterium terrae]NRF70118.1 DUF3016 domain-containing protein [Aquabacterium terrae]